MIIVSDQYYIMNSNREERQLFREVKQHDMSYAVVHDSLYTYIQGDFFQEDRSGTPNRSRREREREGRVQEDHSRGREIIHSLDGVGECVGTSYQFRRFVIISSVTWKRGPYALIPHPTTQKWSL